MKILCGFLDESDFVIPDLNNQITISTYQVAKWHNSRLYNRLTTTEEEITIDIFNANNKVIRHVLEAIADNPNRPKVTITKEAR